MPSGEPDETMPSMEALNLAEIGVELDAKEKDLRTRIEDLTRPPEAGATIGFGKRIGDGTSQAIQQIADASTAKALQTTLDEVLAAQDRIAAGRYGRCTVCGEPIPPARLEFRPWSATCVKHAA